MGREMLWEENVMSKKILWEKKCYGQKNVMGKKLLWAEKCYGQKYVMGRKMLWAEKCYGQKNVIVQRRRKCGGVKGHYMFCVKFFDVS